MKLAFIIIPHETKLGSMKNLLSKTIECQKIEVAVPSDEHDVFIMMAKDVAVEAGVEEIMVQAPDGEILFIPGVK